MFREIQVENALSTDRASLMAWMTEKFRVRLPEVMMAEFAGTPSVFAGAGR